MGETEAEVGRGTRSDLRHDRHTVSLLTDHLVFSPNLSLEKKALPKKQGFPQLKEWCPGHLWAPSCYHKTFKKSFIKNASQSVRHGWEVVEKYISGQKGYEKTDTVPVVVIKEEKEKAHKTWYTSLYNKLFGGTHQK